MKILGLKMSLASWENFKKWFLCQPYPTPFLRGGFLKIMQVSNQSITIIIGALTSKPPPTFSPSDSSTHTVGPSDSWTRPTSFLSLYRLVRYFLFTPGGRWINCHLWQLVQPPLTVSPPVVRSKIGSNCHKVPGGRWQPFLSADFAENGLALTVSPSAKIATWRYWFRLSCDVYVGNRFFASYTKTKTVESAIWCLLTRLDDGDSQQDRNTWTRFRVKNSSFLLITINRIK